MLEKMRRYRRYRGFSFLSAEKPGRFWGRGKGGKNKIEIAKKIKLLRMYGEEERYRSVMVGRNSRLDELQAAILLVKLKYLDIWNERRREIATIYLKELARVSVTFFRTAQA